MRFFCRAQERVFAWSALEQGSVGDGGYGGRSDLLHAAVAQPGSPATVQYTSPALDVRPVHVVLVLRSMGSAGMKKPLILC